ncbi:allophanate hydrolase subunit 1 [Nocardioides sp. GY 10127]|uniref:5-oxoprolinase subunit B family protein n=1 Tax=Nocardioides sp. GY 10127 TaxID=2569762 RepID=UPI0010A91E32|nr:allophanate hydrolase subunit 1 [Nocardioides sp. GY 10127]TIC85429.1 allophanate hydrolase subunit 1 [Nocardioides sp. GY 10127]
MSAPGPVVPRLLPCGPGAWLVEVDGPQEAAGLATHLRTRLGAGLREVVPGATSVLVETAPGGPRGRGLGPEALGRVVDDWAPAAAGSQQAPAVVVPVTYDGEDLPVLAEAWGCTVAEVVRRHTAASFVSVFCGFAPGFAYLAGEDGSWPVSVPRLASPRPRVPAGSVALAGGWCGVYPTASPGGWRLLGRTDVVLFDAGADRPALLAPGTRVRFVDAAQERGGDGRA